MEMWEALSERRLVVSAEDLKSPLGTAAPTLWSRFQGVFHAAWRLHV